jgi:5-methylcytosine-specific restriction endonuclease McrA
VLRRDGHKCAYCGKAAHTIDHVHPKSRGGADSWENLVAACLRCNNVKGDHTPGEMGWKLRFVPEPPRGAIWQIKELEKPAPAWDPFLLPERAA